ncbi:conjugal transfer protein TraF [Saccharospirillum sp.]|uniref:conjugal transfer protein TraF n=1 Tax=Saccharospirillum sp. TaxID=2033801 RepID=UPI0034A082E8
MKKTLLTLSVIAASAAQATPFTGNDAKSNAMGNTGVASAASFSMGQFNPALLAAHADQTRFSMLLPSAKFAIDDSYGFLATSEVVENFDNTDTNEVQLQVEGGTRDDGTTVISLEASVQATIDASQQFEDASTSEELQVAAEALADSNTTLDNKIISIRTELQNLEIAINDTNNSLSELEDKPLSIMAHLGAAMALPRDGISFAFHLSNDTTLGLKATVGDNDLNTISLAVSDTVAYTGEAQDITGLSATVSEKAEATADAEAEFGFGTPEYQDALDELIIATAALEAETSGSDTNYTLSDNSTGTETYDGNNVETYTSANGFYQNGQFNSELSAVQNFGNDSSITVVGANIVEFGVSAARNFEYMGETFSVGVTPKLQSLTIFEDTLTFSNAEEEIGDDPEAYFSSNTKSYFTGNVDIGGAMTWNNVLRGNVTAGVVIKDLIPQTFESESGSELNIGPKMRIGGAHVTRWTTLAADLDITENQPLKYGAPTRYFGLGAEFNAYNWFTLRAGYRNNLSLDDSHVVSTGFGLTPWGVGFDVSTWFKPKSFDNWEEVIQDAGVVAQFSMEF